MSFQILPNEIMVNIFHQMTNVKDVLNCRLDHVASDSHRHFDGKSVILQNKNLRRRHLKFLFNLMPALKNLAIFGAHPRPIIYDLIADYFPHLQGLCISDATLSEDNFVKLIKSLPNLKVLRFTRESREFEKKPPLLDLTQGLKLAQGLRSIYLGGHFKLDESFQFHESLEELEIELFEEHHYFNPLNYETLMKSCRLNLKRLSVLGSFTLMLIFQNFFPNLEHFEWNKRDEAQDFEFQAYADTLMEARSLKTLPNLKTLVLKFFDEALHCFFEYDDDDLPFSDSDMQMYLVNFLPNLNSLCLDSSCNLESLAAKCPNIERLQFNGSVNPKLDDSSCHLLGKFKKLRELRVESPLVTIDCIRIIIESCDKLERLFVGGLFDTAEAQSLAEDMSKKKNRPILFDDDIRYVEVFWRNTWLNRFPDVYDDTV